MEKSKCAVCGAEAVGVCASSLGAVSFAFCQECIQGNAEPYGILLYSIADVGLDNCSDWIYPIIEGTLKRVNKTMKEFYSDLELEKEKLKEMWDDLRKEEELGY